MYKHQSLEAWKRAHAAVLLALRSTDAASRPPTWALFDQLRRAAISIEANIVEGYALGTVALCRRHLRIALGSAAEAECLVRTSGEMGYLDRAIVDQLEQLWGATMAALIGLMRSSPITERPQGTERTTHHSPRR